MILYSIIIPTFNSHNDLNNCLSSILLLGAELDICEVIVVDDGSSDDTAKTAMSFKDKFTNFTYYYQNNKGPAAARNKGAEIAAGEYVIFIDDDCTIRHDWMNKIRNFYSSNEEADGMGGGIVNAVKGNFSEFSQRLGNFLVRSSMANSNQAEYIVSCNSSFKKNVFLEMGGYDERFIWAGAEDRDLCLRFKRAGKRLFFNKDSVVFNNCSLGPMAFCRQHFVYGMSAAFLYQKHNRLPLNNLKTYKDLICYTSGREGFLKRLVFLLIFLVSQISTVLGWLNYRFNYNLYKRPHFIFMPLHAVVIEILKNYILRFGFFRKAKKMLGSSVTTGEELFSASYLSDHTKKMYNAIIYVLRDISPADMTTEGKEILVIGPGSHLGLPILFIAKGAKRVTAIDRFGEVKFGKKESLIYKELIREMPHAESKRIGQILNLRKPKKSGSISLTALNYFQDCRIENISEVLPDASFDLVVSCNALEHVEDLEKAFSGMAYILRDGGIAMHRIDAGTHYAMRRYTKNRLSHYAITKRLFDAMFSNRAAPNRKTLAEYKAVSEKNGFRLEFLGIEEKISMKEFKRTKPFISSNVKGFSYGDLSPVEFIMAIRR